MRRLVNPLRFIRRRIPYSSVLAVMYLITAIAIILSPSRVIQYMADVGLQSDGFVLILAICAAILMGRPNLGWYIIGLIPLALYSGFSIYLAIKLNMGNVAVVFMYSIAITAFPLAYRLCRADGLKIYNMYGAVGLPLALALMASPTMGTVFWIQETYNIWPNFVAFTLGIGSALILITVSRIVFIMFLILLMGYATSAMFFSAGTSPVGVCINAIVFITLVYTMIKVDRYFPETEVETPDDQN